MDETKSFLTPAVNLHLNAVITAVLQLLTLQISLVTPSQDKTASALDLRLSDRSVQ